MASISDCQTALLSALVPVVYPGGTTQPSVVAITPGVSGEVKIFPGWPALQGLDADLRAGIVCLTAFPRPGHDRAGPLSLGESWNVGVAAAPTLTIAVSGNTVSLGGAATTGQLVAILCRGFGFSYAVQAADTPGTVANALATQIAAQGALTARASGATLSVFLAAGMIPIAVAALIGGLSTMWREVAKRESVVSLTVWAPTPASRDQVGGLVDSTIAGYDYLAAPDGSSIKVELDAMRVLDSSENANLYRYDRDILVQYSIVQTMTAPAMLIPGGDVIVSGVAAPFGDEAPTLSVGTGTSPTSPTGTGNGTGGGGATTSPTSAPYFVFTQGTPALTWAVVHALGSYPAVVLVDANGNQIEGDVQYVSDNALVVTFATPTAGSAYLN